jgi:thiol-disulfide isomerase/thioredoxin
MKSAKIIFAILVTLLVIFTANALAEAKMFPKFSTKDIDGDIFTSQIFSESVITIISFWATWDPFCIEDMTELAETYDDLPGEIEMFGILMDGNEPGTIQKAEEIIDYAGADFVQLLPCQEMNDIMSSIKSVPTTIFVDSHGDIVGNTINGARLHDEYLAAIKDILKNMKSNNNHTETIVSISDSDTLDLISSAR